MSRTQTVKARILNGTEADHIMVVEDLTRTHAAALLIGKRPVGFSDRILDEALALLAKHGTEDVLSKALKSPAFSCRPEMFLRALEWKVSIPRLRRLRPLSIGGHARARLINLWINSSERSAEILQLIGEVPTASGDQGLIGNKDLFRTLKKLPLVEALRIDKCIIEMPGGSRLCAYQETLVRSFRSNSIERVMWHLELLLRRFGGGGLTAKKTTLSWYDKRIDFEHAFPDLAPAERLAAISKVREHYGKYGFRCRALLHRAKLSLSATTNRAHENFHRKQAIV